ncbi:hypothetical protein JCM8547_006979 [Rhodosporidiobolus lusitaniae]
MEDGKIRLEGVEAVQNRVLKVHKDAIIAAFKQRSESPESDDSIEIVSNGKKRAAGGSADSPQAKKAALDKSDSVLEVIDFHLTFVSPKDRPALVKAFSKSSADSPSIPVFFTLSRTNAKSPHKLTIHAASSEEALVDLDPIDPASSHITSSWIQYISPPLLTREGKPYKKIPAHLRGVARPTHPVAPFGGGGLFDAVAYLSDSANEGVKLSSNLSFSLFPDETGQDQVHFQLHVNVKLDPADFFPSAYSRSKRLIVEHILPPSRPEDAPAVANLDFFYASLQRAPRTVDGVLVASSLSKNVEEVAAMEFDGEGEQEEETEEHKAARLRRGAKGKQRAISPPPSPPPAPAPVPATPTFEPEDDPLYPPGLTITLMPFQSRTVRWMLAREGKRVLPRREHEAMDVDADDHEEREENRHPPVLADLDEEMRREMKRGPLWEKVRIRTIGGGGEAEGGKEVWLNRVSMGLSETYPLDPKPRRNGLGAVKGEEGEDEDEVEKEDEAEEHTQTSNKIVGGSEGHGLLAEEVGLGKTCEVMAVILLHRDPSRRKLPSYYNPITDSQVQPSGVTLIIAPTAIVGQWEQELKRLSPESKVLRYEGIKSISESWTAAKLVKRYDVFLTTFDVLRKETAFARKPVQKGLRNAREIRYRRSLLVEIDFLRVVMDEAQMIGDAMGPASECASLISRRFSWAVTSTPLRDKIADLRPLLTFLRVEPISSGHTSLQRLLEETGSFKRLFNEIAARTLKTQVTHELTLPKQLKFIVPVDFTAIESYYYDTRYHEALHALGLSEDGVPLAMDVDPDTGAPLPWTFDNSDMNKWLTTLRQLAVHPQLGAGGREKLGRVLKTVDEVYASMKQQTVSAIQSDQRALLAARVRRGQYQMWDKEVEDRFQPALIIFQNAIEDLDPIIAEVTKEIHAVWEEGNKAAKKGNKARAPSADSEGRQQGLAGALELGFRADQHQKDEHEILSDKERAMHRQVGALRNRLRDLLFVKHSVYFLSGHANYNMKREKEEAEEYDKAEKLRKVVLQPYENAVERAQTSLDAYISAREELGVEEMEIDFDSRGHGLRAIQVFEDIEAASDIGNGYAELIFQYRTMILEMAATSVSISGEATGEEYEERAALQEKLDNYLQAYELLVHEWSWVVSGVRSAQADTLKAEAQAIIRRQEFLPEPAPPPKGIEPDEPIEDLDDALDAAVNAIAGGSKRRKVVEVDEDHEEEPEGSDASSLVDEEDSPNKKKGKGKRKKKAPQEKTRWQAKRTANLGSLSYKEFVAPTIEFGNTPAEVLRYELEVERIEAKGEGREFYEPSSLRSLTKKLKEAEDDTDRPAEAALLEREKKRILGIIAPLEDVADRLRLELDQITKCFNARVTYYAQLQLISDTVADPDMGAKGWKGLENEIAALKAEEAELVQSIASKAQRRRYLENLNAPDAEQEAKECPICAEFFSRGIITNCGHLTCESCFRRWQSQNNTCALCKTKLLAGSYTSVKYAVKLVDAPQQDEQNDRVNKPEQPAFDPNVVAKDFEGAAPKLRMLDEKELTRVRDVATAPALSSKSDLVVKHVKDVRRRDPTAKIVIFSAWQDALTMLMDAFTRNGVHYIRLEGAQGKGKKEQVVKRFTEDVDIPCFLLHTRSQSAGLNLTVARYVFLIEPLLHPSLELQAVARVHRIGQRVETIVHQYVVRNTVDERVAEMRARQGTSLFVEDDEEGAKKSRFGKQRAEIKKAAGTSDETLDDEDALVRTLLAPEAYTNLQRALLPLQLRFNGTSANGSGAEAGPAAAVAGGSGGRA